MNAHTALKTLVALALSKGDAKEKEAAKVVLAPRMWAGNTKRGASIGLFYTVAPEIQTRKALVEAGFMPGSKFGSWWSEDTAEAKTFARTHAVNGA